jgi:hypothetical protein
MVKRSLTLILVFAGLFAQSCASTNVDSIALKAELFFGKQLEPNKEVLANQTVSFKGVSFNYNPQIFGEVKSEEVPEYALQYETDKPDGVEPRHIRFIFDSGRSDGEISVFPLEDFPRMYAVNKSSVKYIEKEIADLKKALKDENYRVKNQIPYLRFIDAHQSFQSKVKHLRFQSGKGILFLTQYDIEPSLINNEGLTYLYQGITNDEKHYVLASFSVNVSFLPKDYEVEEFQGYKLYPYSDFAQRYKKYISEIRKRLEDLPAEQFQPNLKYIEELISSLKVEK